MSPGVIVLKRYRPANRPLWGGGGSGGNFFVETDQCTQQQQKKRTLYRQGVVFLCNMGVVFKKVAVRLLSSFFLHIYCCLPFTAEERHTPPHASHRRLLPHFLCTIFLKVKTSNFPIYFRPIFFLHVIKVPFSLLRLCFYVLRTLCYHSLRSFHFHFFRQSNLEEKFYEIKPRCFSEAPQSQTVIEEKLENMCHFVVPSPPFL